MLQKKIIFLLSIFVLIAFLLYFTYFNVYGVTELRYNFKASGRQEKHTAIIGYELGVCNETEIWIGDIVYDVIDIGLTIGVRDTTLIFVYQYDSPKIVKTIFSLGELEKGEILSNTTFSCSPINEMTYYSEALPGIYMAVFHVLGKDENNRDVSGSFSLCFEVTSYNRLKFGDCAVFAQMRAKRIE